jgi:polysaccharide export outer membrane protein
MDVTDPIYRARSATSETAISPSAAGLAEAVKSVRESAGGKQSTDCSQYMVVAKRPFPPATGAHTQRHRRKTRCPANIESPDAQHSPSSAWLLLAVLTLLITAVGCHTANHAPAPMPLTAQPAAFCSDMPRELRKVVLPDYVIEPPDILVVEAVNIIPKAPYLLRVADVLSIRCASTLPDAPINGPYPIGPGGEVDLGYPYGSVPVAGMSMDQANQAIRAHLEQFLREPMATIGLLEMSGKQQIAGEHLVAPDGTVNLGTYGRVHVIGMTVDQARRAIEQHLTQFLEAPEIAVDVFAYNSKVYYVITEGAGIGDTVTRFPVTGSETVLDAISNVNGLSAVSSSKIWVARPSPHTGEVQILPVDWKQVTGMASTATNYQLMPGDRVFVAENELVAFDNGLSKLLAPFERIMGFSLLGAGTVTRFSGPVLRGGGNPVGQGGRF